MLVQERGLAVEYQPDSKQEALKALAGWRIAFRQGGRDKSEGARHKDTWVNFAQKNESLIQSLLETSEIADYLTSVEDIKVKLSNGTLRSVGANCKGVYASVVDGEAQLFTKSDNEFVPINVADIFAFQFLEFADRFVNRRALKNFAEMSAFDIIDKFRSAIGGPRPVQLVKRIFS